MNKAEKIQRGREKGKVRIFYGIPFKKEEEDEEEVVVVSICL